MLQENMLTVIKPSIFRSLRQITLISLADNNLFDLDNNLFDKNPKLIELRLHNNHLTTIPPAVSTWDAVCPKVRDDVIMTIPLYMLCTFVVKNFHSRPYLNVALISNLINMRFWYESKTYFPLNIYHDGWTILQEEGSISIKIFIRTGDSIGKHFRIFRIVTKLWISMCRNFSDLATMSWITYGLEVHLTWNAS